MLGLEVHVELNTTSKMFCGCSTAFGAEPNTQVCAVCLGLPGSLPVANHKAVESAIRIGLALDLRGLPVVPLCSEDYFYPDMPKNYQISQYDKPIAYDGWTEVGLDGQSFRIGIERADMEEDTGKSLHVGGATGRIHGADYSLLDYNRSGDRSSRSSRSRSRGPALRRRRWRARTSPCCAICSARSGSPTSGWSRGRYAATPTSRCDRSAPRQRDAD